MSGILETVPRKTLLTIRDFESECGLNHWAIRRAVARGEVACVRPGGPKGKLYFRREDIDAYLKRARHAAVGEGR